MINKSIKIIGKARSTMSQLNDDYQRMSQKNQNRSSSSQNSISLKSKELAEKKINRSKHFDIIRNK